MNWLEREIPRRACRRGDDGSVWPAGGGIAAVGGTPFKPADDALPDPGWL